MDTHPIPSNSFNGLPLISIIIPTLNEENFIEKTLNQLAAQSYPKNLVEIFVIDGGSIDKTYDIVSRWAEKSNFSIQIVCNHKRISSCARNIGVSLAKGEYVLFIDAHVFIPSNELLENMARSARDRNAMVLGRAQPLTPPMLSNFQQVVAGVRSSKLGHSTKSFIFSDFEGWVSPVSIGAMYHHSVFDNTEHFDEYFDAAEDVEFNFRLESKGYKAYISPNFKILYYPRENIQDLVKQMFRYGLGRARFTNKHIKGFQSELFVPIGVLTILLATAPLIFNPDTLKILIIIMIFSYLACALLLCKKFTRIRHLLAAPVCLFTIHIGLAAGIIAGIAECFFKKLLQK